VRFDPSSLDDLRARHPAWRLLRYERAPLAIAFLYRAFVAENVRALVEDDALELLDDLLYAQRGEDEGGRPAKEYLVDWASDERSFVRRYYPLGSDEPHVSITPGAERAIAWLSTLTDTTFVGTESRLLTAIELLRQLDIGTDPNAEIRLADLKRRRDELDLEIRRVESGDLRLLDDRAVAERFHQFTTIARELLADFRQVEENFRALDRTVRERIAQWDGSKGDLLGEVFGERDVITSSDQGASFRGFWDVLSSVSRQDELADRLNRVMGLAPIAAMTPDRRLRRVHHDWFNAGDHTQRTVASLSSQLRRFIDDKTWLENRRIVEILRSVEAHALAVRDDRPIAKDFLSIAAMSAEVSLPMELKLASAVDTSVVEVGELLDDHDADLAALFADSGIDLLRLADHVDDLLIDRSQVTLADVCERRPLTSGLAELVAYLQLDDDRFESAFLEDQNDEIGWIVSGDDKRVATLPRVVFVRG
jgi:Protein of unknown function (DUF3375)